MAKSTKTISYSISGIFDKEAGTVTQYAKKETEEDKVFIIENILEEYDGKDVTFTYKETSDLESDE
jgi:hypothetical protein